MIMNEIEKLKSMIEKKTFLDYEGDSELKDCLDVILRHYDMDKYLIANCLLEYPIWYIIENFKGISVNWDTLIRDLDAVKESIMDWIAKEHCV